LDFVYQYSPVLRKNTTCVSILDRVLTCGLIKHMNNGWCLLGIHRKEILPNMNEILRIFKISHHKKQQQQTQLAWRYIYMYYLYLFNHFPLKKSHILIILEIAWSSIYHEIYYIKIKCFDFMIRKLFYLP
jgi:hypothetical protein